MDENELTPELDEGIEVIDEELDEVSSGADQFSIRKKIVCYACGETGYIRRGETTCPHCGAALKKSQVW